MTQIVSFKVTFSPVNYLDFLHITLQEQTAGGVMARQPGRDLPQRLIKAFAVIFISTLCMRQLLKVSPGSRLERDIAAVHP